MLHSCLRLKISCLSLLSSSCIRAIACISLPFQKASVNLANLFRKPQRNAVLRELFFCLPALGWVEGLRLAAGEAFDWLGLLCRWGFIVGCPPDGACGPAHRVSGSRWLWPWPAGISLVLGAGAAAISLGYHNTAAAWVWLGAFFVVLLQLSSVFSAAESKLRRWTMYLLLALYAGMLPAAIGQVQGRFSDEEFFVAIQALPWACFGCSFGFPIMSWAVGKPTTRPQMRGRLSVCGASRSAWSWWAVRSAS